MYKSIFLDANIISDIYDSTRPYYQQSKEVVFHLAKDSEVELFTSCDLITTLYYILSKKDKEKALDAILQINELCTIIDFSNNEIKKSCDLMISDTDYKDLEDTIQYILAKKVSADLIISNDKKFISKDIKLVTSMEFSTLLK